MRVHVFGASLSDQTINRATGEITGYVEALRREHAGALGITELHQVTYPGSRMSDGGLLRLSEVLEARPDICLVEPLIEDRSRGTDVRVAEARHVYQSLLAAGILPVLIMAPNTAARPFSAPPNKNLHMNLAKELGLSCVFLYPGDVESADEKFRGVHTLAKGARLYAKQIAVELRKLALSEHGIVPLPKQPTVPDAITISGLKTPPLSSGKLRRIEVALSCSTDQNVNIRMVQKQKIGPFSPVLDVTIRMKKKKTDNVWHVTQHDKNSCWDSYCHYERDTYMTLANFNTKKHGYIEISLNCSSDSPDYATSRKEVDAWPAPEGRFMKPIKELACISDTRLEAKIIKYEEN